MTYDFDEQYGVLPRLDQGQSPTCWYEAHTLLLTALRHIHYADSAEVVSWAGFPGEKLADDFTFGHERFGRWQMTSPSGEQHVVWNEGKGFDIDNPDALALALRRNGVVDASILATQSFMDARSGTSLPVVRPLATDQPGFGHEQVIVGYTDDGLITQNSWGPGWGYQGRAVLSWEWCSIYMASYLPEGIDDFPIDPLPPTLLSPRQPPPAALTSEDIVFVFKKAAKPAVWALLGSGKVWFRNATDASRQGVDPTKAVVLPDDHAYFNDALYPVIGAGPAATLR